MSGIEELTFYFYWNNGVLCTESASNFNDNGSSNMNFISEIMPTDNFL